MPEPSPVDDIRADLQQIRETLACHGVDFPYSSLREAIGEAVRALSPVPGVHPVRSPLDPYLDAGTLLRDVRLVRDRLERGIEDGSIPEPHVLPASSALIELARGIALHLRMTRRHAAKAVAA